MTLRTPAIWRDRPTVRGSPALRARSTSAGLAPAEFPQRTIRVMLRTTRVRASIRSRTAFQNVVFKFGLASWRTPAGWPNSPRSAPPPHRPRGPRPPFPAKPRDYRERYAMLTEHRIDRSRRGGGCMVGGEPDRGAKQRAARQ